MTTRSPPPPQGFLKLNYQEVNQYFQLQLPLLPSSR